MNVFSSVWRSFQHATRGLLLAFRTERSFRIQCVAACMVMFVVILFPFRSWERVVLLLATAGVLVLELVNSMVERLVDLVKPRMHGYVHDIKDLMAAAVFLTAFFAFIIGLFIIWPHAGEFLRRV